MMLSDINYYKPESIDNALELLSKSPDTTRILAGGTDVIPGIMQRSGRFKYVDSLIDLAGIESLHEVNINNNNLEIGSYVTYSEIQKNKIINEFLPVLVKSSSTVGSPQIRNRATVVGNIVNCAPCADSVPPLLLFDSLLRIKSASEIREVKIEDFIINAYQTHLRNNEIITHIIVPLVQIPHKTDFYKLGRRQAVNISRITFASLVSIENGKFSDFRFSAGAVTPIGKRFRELEEEMIGKKISESLLKDFCVKAGKSILSLTGYRWSSDYKIPVTQQTLFKFLFDLCSLDGGIEK